MKGIVIMIEMVNRQVGIKHLTVEHTITILKDFLFLMIKIHALCQSTMEESILLNWILIKTFLNRMDAIMIDMENLWDGN